MLTAAIGVGSSDSPNPSARQSSAGRVGAPGGLTLSCAWRLSRIQLGVEGGLAGALAVPRPPLLADSGCSFWACPWGWSGFVEHLPTALGPIAARRGLNHAQIQEVIRGRIGRVRTRGRGLAPGRPAVVRGLHAPVTWITVHRALPTRVAWRPLLGSDVQTPPIRPAPGTASDKFHPFALPPGCSL